MATTLFVRHRVADYEKWREVYEAFGKNQRASGVVDEVVFHNPEDPNDLTITHEFMTLEQAKAFITMPELREAMGQAGVVGEPEIWFADKI